MPFAYASANLVFRAPEPEDTNLFLALLQDASVFQNSSPWLARPQSTKDAIGFMKAHEDAFMGIVMCLASPESGGRPEPIGALKLSVSGNIRHNQFGEIGIVILPKYQGKGYGGETLRWVLDWAFDIANLHRVGIRAFEYNHGARRLYERVGFKPEGISREMIWHRGRYWDDYQFGILDREWRLLRGQAEAVNK